MKVPSGLVVWLNPAIQFPIPLPLAGTRFQIVPFNLVFVKEDGSKNKEMTQRRTKKLSLSNCSCVYCLGQHLESQFLRWFSSDWIQVTLRHPSVIHLCQYWGGLPKDSLNSYGTKCKGCVTFTTQCTVVIQDFWSWTFIYLLNSWTNQNSALPLASSALGKA